MAYANGRLPASALALIPGTNRYIAVALLPQVIALRAAFKARFGKDLIISDAYRSYAGQVAARNRYLNGTGAYAVPPGTSNHGWAEAIDFGSRVNILNSEEHKWMVANAPNFGFVWLARAGNGSIEPWHFDGGVVPASSYINFPGVPGAPVVTPPDPIEEEDLPLNDDDKRWIQGAINTALTNYRPTQRLDLLEQANKSRDGVPQMVWDHLIDMDEAGTTKHKAWQVVRDTRVMVRELVGKVIGR